MSEFIPHGYQSHAIDLIRSGESFLLGMEMGLGKTVTTLTGVQSLLQSGAAHNVLVVAPVQVAKHTWAQEIDKWSHLNLTCSVVVGTPKQRLAALHTDADIYCINYENLEWLFGLMGKDPTRWPFDTVVLDESSKVKSSSTKRFKMLRKVRPYALRFILLTGTPAPNGLMDLWSQLYLLDMGDRLGKSMYWFRQTYFYQTNPNFPDYRLRDGSAATIMQKISDVCITMRAKDYLTLPRFNPITIEVDLPGKARDTYRELELTMVAELDSAETVNAANAAVLTGKLLQVANGALYHEDGSEWTELHREKLDALERIIEESGGAPVLVFYNYKHDLERMQKRFPSGCSIKDPGVLYAWNRGEVPLLFAHPASAGHGLNLQHGGNILVWFGVNWSLELYEQANARLHRQGQTKPVFAYHILASDTLDYEVLDRLQNKRDVQDVLKDYLKRKTQ